MFDGHIWDCDDISKILENYLAIISSNNGDSECY